MRIFLAGLILFFGLIFFNPQANFLKSTFTPKSQSYTIVLVGDSMSESLGTADPLRDALKNYYPDKGFGILNFSIGSTSILSVPDRLKSESKRGDETLPPVLGVRPDIILLESFGNNPLSQFPLEEGLKKQTETLDEILNIIKDSKQDPVLIFVATISPSREKYAQGVVDLSSEQREKWADERIAYIKNHINYAKTHNIPLVNIYEQSLNGRGDGNTDYLNPADYIHPSPAGIRLISQQIADYIFTKQIIPD